MLLALQRATHATLHLITAELAGLELTASEINTLASLADGKARTVSGLAAATGNRPTTLTSVLDRLERRGHITRGIRAGDRRSVLIELTGAGRATAAVITAALAGLEGRALAGLPAETVAAFYAVADALTASDAPIAPGTLAATDTPTATGTLTATDTPAAAGTLAGEGT